MNMYLLVICEDFRDTIMRNTIAELIDLALDNSVLRPGCASRFAGDKMNKVTNAERDRILKRAMEIVKLDADLAVVDHRNAIAQIMSEFGISHDRALGAVSRAARRQRTKATKNWTQFLPKKLVVKL